MANEDAIVASIAFHYKLLDEEQLAESRRVMALEGTTLLDAAISLNFINTEQVEWMHRAVARYKSHKQSRAAQKSKGVDDLPFVSASIISSDTGSLPPGGPETFITPQPMPTLSPVPRPVASAPIEVDFPIAKTSPTKRRGKLETTAVGSTPISEDVFDFPLEESSASDAGFIAETAAPTPDTEDVDLGELVRDADRFEQEAPTRTDFTPPPRQTVPTPQKVPHSQKTVPPLEKSAREQWASADSVPVPMRSRTSIIRPRATTTGDFDTDVDIATILAKAVKVGASDVHLHTGSPILFRINGKLAEQSKKPLSEATILALIKEALPEDQLENLLTTYDLETTVVIPEVARFRTSMYRQQRGWDAVFRPISLTPPTFETLKLPASLKRLLDYHQGLILMTGPTGCGKSSTLAALVSLLNASRHSHIITIEDPIEYIHTPMTCVVNQRQAGVHTASYPTALRAALREDPDIIVIGELRDLESISLAVTAADTGHLVLGTMHTNNAIRTVNRILDVFPPDQQKSIRLMLSDCLRAVVSQRLVPTADGNGRVPALELLWVKPAVANMIREEKTFQIRSVMQTGRGEGMLLIDESLAELVKSGTITKAVAAEFAEDPKRFGGTTGERHGAS